MFISKSKEILVMTISLILLMSSLSFSGVYYIEVPGDITDEMMINQTPKLRSELIELINEEVRGSVDEIKTIT